MLKIILFFLGLIFLSASNLNAQEYKRNLNWVIGLDALNFNFNSNKLQIDTLKNTLSKVAPYSVSDGSNSTISDTNGNLQFFSVGYFIYDKDGLPMANSEFVNCPIGNKLADFYGMIALFVQTDIIIPKKNNEYYVIGTGMSDSVADRYINHVETKFDVLSYSIVNMDSNRGKGAVTLKNQILTQGQNYSSTAIHATKHANGRDWWLVKEDANNNGFQVFLVTADTIIGPYFQAVTQHGNFRRTLFSKIYFNTDGDMLCGNIYGDRDADSFYNFNRVDIYNFDRCTGNISNYKYYTVPFDTSSYLSWDFTMGSTFSPNNKLLYINSYYNIWQINLANDSLVHIHGMDTSEFYFPWYWYMGLGPNGKIYMANAAGTRPFMSYIDAPNELGKACDFKPQGLWQPYTNILGPPNMPNYGLGALKGSPCDTILPPIIIPVPAAWLLYPNPAYNSIKLKIPNSIVGNSIGICMFNMLGQQVLQGAFIIDAHYEITIPTSNLANGVYVLKTNNSNSKFVGKFLKE
jgi:Secretion system C-terminal sorting domain